MACISTIAKTWNRSTCWKTSAISRHLGSLTSKTSTMEQTFIGSFGSTAARRAAPQFQDMGLIDYRLGLSLSPKDFESLDEQIQSHFLLSPQSSMAYQSQEEAAFVPLQAMNRNARKPSRANHGARPCSRRARRWKKEKIGRRRR